MYQLSGGEDGEQHENAPPQRLPGRVVLVQGRLEEGGRGEEEAHDTHDTLPFFAAIFFPHRKVRFLPSATSLVLVRGGVGVAATVGKGNSGEEKGWRGEGLSPAWDILLQDPELLENLS